ncbi:MAG: hypothetical protein RJA78_222 [Actinomycetota bacterium]|jgi:hypothetical protein
MNEKDLIELWNKSRNQLIIAQFAPTFLLITTSIQIPAIREAGAATVWGVLGILLASGILGALVEFSAAHEAQAIADDIKALGSTSSTSKAILTLSPWLHVAKYLTPAIFVGIFVALTLALLG